MNPDTTMMSYGLGWTIQDYRGQQLISHGGSIDGYRAQVALLPKARVGMVILSNLGRTSMPEAVRNNVVDHVLGLEKKDWNAHYLTQLRRGEAAQKAKDKQREAKRHQGTKPSRSLTDYTGAYEEPAYGKASVVLENGNLLVQWSNFKIRLEHYHYDTFTTHGDPLVDNQLLSFTLGTDGEVEKMNFLSQDFRKVRNRPTARPGG
jgi:hypothetical protein